MIEQLSSSPAHKAKYLVYVDDQEYSRVALKFACIKAKNAGCPVEILHVIETENLGLFSLTSLLKRESREEAEALVNKLAEQAYEWTGITPACIIREGLLADEIISTIDEDNHINMLILGAASDGSGKKQGLLPRIASQIGTRFHIPVLIIPCNLTDQQIEELN